MQPIQRILFEPVGCLAEFPAEPFREIAVRFFGASARKKPSRSASREYWHLLNLIEGAECADLRATEALELQAVDDATVFEDVAPALQELRSMGVALSIASSLSTVAVERFLGKNALTGLFDQVWTRDNSGGIKTAPLVRAVGHCSPDRAIFLTDTSEGIKTAQIVGVNAILMMNDPDDAKRLASRGPGGGPAGGIVSLHELQDFIRLVAAQSPRDAGTLDSDAHNSGDRRSGV